MNSEEANGLSMLVRMDQKVHIDAYVIEGKDYCKMTITRPGLVALDEKDFVYLKDYATEHGYTFDEMQLKTSQNVMLHYYYMREINRSLSESLLS